MLAKATMITHLPAISLDVDSFQTLYSAKEFQAHLLQQIKTAQHRIYIAALYLEQDEAGRIILDALYQAKQQRPELDIKVLVDWHRAQRGLMGAEKSAGNAEMYQEYAQRHEHVIPVYGVPVRGREVFGVLHLKGFVVDDCVTYSGASLNNIYLHHGERYRFDRYHVIKNSKLANSMTSYMQKVLVENSAVRLLSDENKPTTKDLKSAIRQLRSRLSNSHYQFEPDSVNSDQLRITPLVGAGKRRNLLNKSIISLLKSAREEVIICTPYFNFPSSVEKEVKRAIKRGIHVKIIVGDKTANDFYIPPSEPFSTAGGLPYLYEISLRRFAKKNEALLANRSLSIHLWKHEMNSYHLKGMWVDQKNMLLTGNNLNPRAWGLDLENGLLIQDPQQQLHTQFSQEMDNILEHTTLIGSYRQLEKIDTYPSEVQKLLRKITAIKADKILKRLL